MRKIINELIKWIGNKRNYPTIIFFALGITLASYKYGFVPAILTFLIIILFSLIVGIIIKSLIK